MKSDRYTLALWSLIGATGWALAIASCTSIG